MPRVAMVADTLAGGLGAALANGCRFLGQRGWDVTVLAPPPGRGAPPLEATVLHPVAVPRSARSVGELRAAGRQIRGVLRDLRPDVVHCHGPRSFVAARVFGGQRALLTLHGTGAVADDPAGYHLLRRAGLSVVPHLATAAFSAVPGFPRPWRFAPHASPLLPALEAAPPIDEDAAFLWLARLDEPKLPLVFVEAIKDAAGYGGVRGEMAGTGPMAAQVRSLVESRGAPVELLGHRDDIARLIHRCRAVVLLSRFEAVPFAVSEAMWAGRAVIASDLPGTRWLAGGGQHGVTLVTDRPSATAAMRRLADVEVAAADGRRAAARVRELLSVDAPWPAVEAAYRAVLAR